MVTHLDQRLDHLRRLDDVLGGAQLRRAVLAECELAQRLTTDTIYDDAVADRLYSTISEAARICGWQHFDAGLHAAAQRFYTTSLRASATGADPQAGAHTLSFMAIQTYSVGSPFDAVQLVEAALEQTLHTVTPRAAAMLHVRLARALSKTPDGAQRCLAELDRAQDAYARGTHDDDPPWTYWLTDGELEMLAGSCALDLGRPDRALDHFATARELHYAAEGYVRDDALYLARAATAHLDQGDIDQACAVAREALARSSTVDSTRPTGALREFRARLSTEHPGHRGARAFLAQHREATTGDRRWAHGPKKTARTGLTLPDNRA
jgi:tetratricopeptide (TPR) repeat protein